MQEGQSQPALFVPRSDGDAPIKRAEASPTLRICHAEAPRCSLMLLSVLVGRVRGEEDSGLTSLRLLEDNLMMKICTHLLITCGLSLSSLERPRTPTQHVRKDSLISLRRRSVNHHRQQQSLTRPRWLRVQISRLQCKEWESCLCTISRKNTVPK